LSRRQAEVLIEATADALASVAPEVKQHFAQREGEVGLRMLEAWNVGMKESLGVMRGLVTVEKTPRARSR
jgi:hypothetical protein